jgi:hypothetical protein
LITGAAVQAISLAGAVSPLPFIAGHSCPEDFIFAMQLPS